MKDALDQPPMSIAAYLEGLDSFKRNEVAQVLDFSLPVIESINRKYGGSDTPEIRIIPNEAIGAEANVYVIRLNTGLIDHILIPPPASPQEVISRKIPAFFGGNPSAMFSLVWILAHEWMHVVRKHNELHHHIQDTDKVSQALEYDADLCGTAEIYRLMQRLFGAHVDDLQIRKYAAYSIFWTLRVLPNYGENNSHGSHTERLYHICQKLAIINKNPLRAPDINASKPETQERCISILNAVIKCEDIYLSLQQGTSPTEHIASVWQRFIETNEHLTTVETWESIKEIVARISETRTSPLSHSETASAQAKARLNKKRDKKICNKKQRKARAKNRKTKK
ncbi:hypothetical protein I5L56_09540 [Pseudomonas oryzihabitans]|uniref:hypothetical protein n=1 Tax=Pseudomonas oryzihabitans TaxID=47885 RepID=UPI0018D7EA1D|nr:hypothetical protein [Pseudomonas oryzihabitans]MBH3329864.1 hypothetical protein [Pseudomonas oryzihabitans]